MQNLSFTSTILAFSIALIGLFAQPKAFSTLDEDTLKRHKELMSRVLKQVQISCQDKKGYMIIINVNDHSKAPYLGTSPSQPKQVAPRSSFTFSGPQERKIIYSGMAYTAPHGYYYKDEDLLRWVFEDLRKFNNPDEKRPKAGTIIVEVKNVLFSPPPWTGEASGQIKIKDDLFFSCIDIKCACKINNNT